MGQKSGPVKEPAELEPAEQVVKAIRRDQRGFTAWRPAGPLVGAKYGMTGPQHAPA
jgi:hypothetical protein